ncbi:MAG: transglutaminase family protein [Mogibacterium sp.]|nr:transglutaminase family protein [Mogibacterium sp.]
MLLNYTYKMKLEFSGPVTDQYFSLMCVPRDTQRQKAYVPEITVNPEVRILQDTDGLGNIIIYGAASEPHEEFGITVKGRVETFMSPHEEYESPDSPELWRYRVMTLFTEPGPAVTSLFEQCKAKAPDDDYGKVLYYAGVVRDALEYESGSTDSATTAEGALCQGKGVCQDYAHLLISLLRMNGIPARYTVGLMQGEGESHAWAEANCSGYWYGIDPTNGLLVDENYIKFSHGRDYRDCMISRGIFRNPLAKQAMNVSVLVRSAEQ